MRKPLTHFSSIPNNVKYRHRCDYRDPENYPLGYSGITITLCLETVDGYLWIINDDSQNVVNYCPFCGYKAIKPIGKTYPHEEDDS